MIHTMQPPVKGSQQSLTLPCPQEGDVCNNYCKRERRQQTFEVYRFVVWSRGVKHWDDPPPHPEVEIDTHDYSCHQGDNRGNAIANHQAMLLLPTSARFPKQNECPGE